MCDLCRALGSELDTLWHSRAQAVYDGAGDGAPAIAYANSVSQDTSVEPKIDGVLSGFKWSGTVTYSFTNSASDYVAGYADGMPLTGFAQVSANEKLLVDKVMTYIEDITNLTIQRNDEAGIDDSAADIRIAKSPEANPTAFAYYPDNEPDGSGGDVWIGTTSGNGYDNPVRGDYAYATHLHEIGHAFGLKHPQDTDTNPTAVPAAEDGLEYSVMSYRSYPGQSLAGGYTNENYGFPQSYMRNDILALQEMYGADFGFNSGDSIYKWSATTGEMSIATDGGAAVGQGAPGANRVFLTIWDGGGNDTYDMSNYASNVSINLEPGLWSVTSTAQKANLGQGHFAQGNVYNAFQYHDDIGSLIENAIGGAGNDTIVGNAADNHLEGRSGRDTLSGGAGNDWLDGGAGNDSITGGAGNDTIYIAGTDGADTLQGGDDIDTVVVTGVSAVTLAGFGPGNSIEVWSGNGAALLGTTASNVFDFSQTSKTGILYTDAGSGNDTLVGSDLADDLRGGAGNDAIAGGDGDDSLYGGAGVDNIDGGLGNDTIYVTGSEASGDTMQGGDGTDTLQVLGTGSVTLGKFGGNAIEVWAGNNTAVLGTKGNDALDFSGLTAKTGLSYVDGGKGNDAVTGSAFADDLRGNGGNDTLNGGGGNDLLNGAKGVDTFIFNGDFGNDTITGFTAGATSSHDIIQFDDAQFAGFAAVTAHASQVGSDVLIALDADHSVTLQSVTLLNLVAADFQFV